LMNKKRVSPVRLSLYKPNLIFAHLPAIFSYKSVLGFINEKDEILLIELSRISFDNLF
jgi:hypothetical protein